MRRTAQAQETFKLGIVSFLSGQAAESFGIPAVNGAKVVVDAFNKGAAPAPYNKTGFGGMKIEAVYVDENGGATKQVQELRNLYDREKVDAMMPAGLTRDHADAVGVALPAAEIRVMDDDGRELAPGEVGELWIGGPMVVPGYWGNAEATATSFTAGFWHSGDLGSVDPEGFVRIVDRKKDMLNRGGYKVYSVKVENVLMSAPGIVEAAVIGVPCPVLGERVHAVLYAPDAAIDDDALRRHCAAQLAEYEVPERFIRSPAPLPRNANGKVLKRVLRALPGD